MVEGVGVIPLVQVAFVHYADHIANGKGLELVVRHEQGGGPRGFQNAAHLVRQPFEFRQLSDEIEDQIGIFQAARAQDQPRHRIPADITGHGRPPSRLHPAAPG